MKENQVVTFYLNGKSFGLNLSKVKEIILSGGISSVPETPESIRGVISFRGQVIPIIDLHKRLKLQTAPPTEEARIILVAVTGKTVGFLVEALHEVRNAAELAADLPMLDLEWLLSKIDSPRPLK